MPVLVIELNTVCDGIVDGLEVTEVVLQGLWDIELDAVEQIVGDCVPEAVVD